MFKIKTLNNISATGLALFPPSMYQLNAEAQADALVIRSASLHDMPVAPQLKAIARAGAGVNNIPVDKMTEMGIPVFNTPGANANAVKELVLAALLIASRHLCAGWQATKELTGQDVPAQAEQLKKTFSGFELPGKTLGVVGLGAIGVKVANAALTLGMRVTAFDPHITIKNAWQLSAEVNQADSLQAVLKASDFVTVHVPYMDKTHHLIDEKALSQMKKSALLLNFARAQIVDTSAVLSALDEEQLAGYLSDFPDETLLHHDKVLCFPHLGASTLEAEENCAVMAVTNLRRYLELGEITHSVNFPQVTMPYVEGVRLAISNFNVPNMLGQISNLVGNQSINIKDMINRSQDNIAYTLMDIETPLSPEGIEALERIEGIITVRQFQPSQEH